MKTLNHITLVALTALFITACGSASSTGDNNEPSDTDTPSAGSGTENVGAAIGSIFGGDEASASLSRKNRILARLADLFVREAMAAKRQMTSACDQLDGPPDDVVVGATVEPGTYGMTGNSVDLEASDGCDQGGEYATFDVASHSLECVDGDGAASAVTMVDSAGVWRENASTNQTEIYGTFNIEVDGETYSDIQCSLTITHPAGEGGGEFGGDCEDGDGQVIEQASETTCTDNS